MKDRHALGSLRGQRLFGRRRHLVGSAVSTTARTALESVWRSFRQSIVASDAARWRVLQSRWGARTVEWDLASRSRRSSVGESVTPNSRRLPSAPIELSSSVRTRPGGDPKRSWDSVRAHGRTPSSPRFFSYDRCFVRMRANRPAPCRKTHQSSRLAGIEMVSFVAKPIEVPSTCVISKRLLAPGAALALSTSQKSVGGLVIAHERATPKGPR